MTKQLFAYGSNMCSGRLQDYSIVPDGPGRVAVLPGYTLRFNKKSQRDGSGKTNVEQCEGEEVWGVLYDIPDDQIGRLDDGEGGYYRTPLPVRTADGATTSAEVYLASRPVNDLQLRPYTWYMRFLIEGARQHGLPVGYIARLQSIDADDDTEQQRDQNRRALTCP